MFKIKLTDNEMFSVGILDWAETEGDAITLAEAYREDYPVEDGYVVEWEEITPQEGCE